MAYTIQEVEKNMQTAVEHFKEDLKGVRTGQANPSMVENVQVEVYGSNMRLRDIASITTPEARQLLITPYDANNTQMIGKGIERANIGFVPNIEGNAIRLNVPPMDEAVREKMGRMCHEKGEKAKVSIRTVRREANDAARREKAEGEIGEDLLKRKEKEIQELTDKYCKLVDALSAEKEKEVSSI